MLNNDDSIAGCPWNERIVRCLFLEEHVEFVQLLSTCRAKKVGRDRAG